MPHLSPMSWLLAIPLFWLSLSILISTLWWSKHHSFSSSSSHTSSISQSSWKWI
uniref:ATP synthase F0 subunit 8 n=1 Tax=Eisenia nordenskioldi nordenskioldi TaxID=1269247 RepID=A0A6B9IX05_9ANNE|nr:ATP synthase F0 subunit 8 [Eisenia nordenskioldi nordenskioldi]